MKKTLTLSSIVLGCCLFASAQTSSYYRIPPGKSYQGSSSADPAAMSANQSANQSAQSASQKTTVQGCLSQSADGMFILSDASGNSYQLNDSSTRLAQFVGKEIRVDGFGIFNGTSESVPGAISTGPSALQGSAQQIDVTRVRKIADSCQSRSGAR